ncbi:DDE superendonuclease family protein [Orientia tsutsugamushi str. UT76]|nr:DDE superendonuclease family protein [Orientia tsutsugamushi str. UT76]
MVDKQIYQVICTDFSNGKKHDFRLFKESKILSILRLKRLLIQDIKVYKKFTIILNYKEKKQEKSLTKNDKKNNRRLAGERVVNENVIGILKRLQNYC